MDLLRWADRPIRPPDRGIRRTRDGGIGDDRVWPGECAAQWSLRQLGAQSHLALVIAPGEHAHAGWRYSRRRVPGRCASAAAERARRDREIAEAGFGVAPNARPRRHG